VAVVHGVGVELVRAAELGENLQPIQLVRLEPVDEIIVQGRIDHETISAGPNTEADEWYTARVSFSLCALMTSRHVISPDRYRHWSVTGVWGNTAHDPYSLFELSRLRGMSAGSEPTQGVNPLVGPPHAAPAPDGEARECSLADDRSIGCTRGHMEFFLVKAVAVVSER
jgi:hypothetical protein